MNLGLGTLAELKSALLAPELRDDTSLDATLMALGLGVAVAFERDCNRSFARVANAVAEFSGGRCHYVLPRYPVEAVTKTELRRSLSGVWEEGDLVTDRDDSAGIIYFDELPRTSRVRVTYTGGYWFNTSEDPENPEVRPENAAPLPDDLNLAWLQQCTAIYQRTPKLGVPMNTTQSTAQAQAVYLSDVAATLAAYRRHQLT